jgi:hypothetical protein
MERREKRSEGADGHGEGEVSRRGRGGARDGSAAFVESEGVVAGVLREEVVGKVEVELCRERGGVAAEREGFGGVNDAEHPEVIGDDVGGLFAQEDKEWVVGWAHPSCFFNHGAVVGEKLQEAAAGGGSGGDDIADVESARSGGRDWISGIKVSCEFAIVDKEVGTAGDAAEIGDAGPEEVVSVEVAGILGGPRAVEGADGGLVIGSGWTDIDGGFTEVEGDQGEFDTA